VVECEYGDFAHVKIINTLVDRKWVQYGLRLYLTKFLIPYIIYLVSVQVSCTCDVLSVI
jgi:hypothetical protein